MKTKNVIKLLSICALTFTTLSCSDDDSQPMMEEEDQTSVRLFTSNNSDGNISILDVTNMSNVQSKTLLTTSTAADGVYYDASADAVFQASRSNLNLEGFYNVDMLLNNTTASIDISSTTDMESPREVAVSGDYYVVADNSDVDGDSNTPDGRLFVYQKTSNNFVLRNTITTNFKLWGIVFSGADLYAIVDTTDQLAVFNNFLSNTTDQTLMASKTISIEGIVKTHGIALDGNTMVLTDIGVASGTATSATDGAFHIISDFSSKFNNTANGGTLALTEQVRVEGSSTLLGNPVDVAYDANTNTVFIAEAANGKILAFNNIGSGGNLSPVLDYNLASASAVYLSK